MWEVSNLSQALTNGSVTNELVTDLMEGQGLAGRVVESQEEFVKLAVSAS
jgi:hypothetical protein